MIQLVQISHRLMMPKKYSVTWKKAKGMLMIEIYTKKQDSPDWILLNDMYFNVYTGNEEISEYEAKLIQQVDKAKLTTDKHIETRYGIGTIRNLSTSCKTLLNIVKHPEKVVSVEECGSDVLKIIFSLDNIKIYMSRPSLVEISETTQMRFDDGEVVTGRSGYGWWWTKEYARRAAED